MSKLPEPTFPIKRLTVCVTRFPESQTWRVVLWIPNYHCALGHNSLENIASRRKALCEARVMARRFNTDLAMDDYQDPKHSSNKPEK